MLSQAKKSKLAIFISLIFLLAVAFISIPTVKAADFPLENSEPEAVSTLANGGFEPEAIDDSSIESIEPAVIGGLTFEWFEPAAELVSSDATSVHYRYYQAVDSNQVHFQWNFSNGLDAPLVDTTNPLLNQVTLKKGAQIITLDKDYDGKTVVGDAEIWTAGDFKYTKQQVLKLRLLEFVPASIQFDPGATYTIEFGPDFRSNNGNTLGKTYSWEFTIAGSHSTAPTWPAGSALTTAGITPTTLTLNWTAATDDQGVTAYKIYQAGTEIATVNGNTQSYKVTGLTPGTNYTFKVEAGDPGGNWSNDGPTVTATTAAADSEAPVWPPDSTLTAANVQAISLTLNWTAATDNYQVASYKIYKDGAELATVTGDDTTYEVTGLSGSTQYTFRVDAGDECNNWSEGPSTTVTTPEGTAAAPILLTAEMTAQGDVSLTFDKPMADPAGTESGFKVELVEEMEEISVTAVELTGTPGKIKLVLQTKITAGQSVQVSYIKSEVEAKQVKATDGGVLETFEPIIVNTSL